MEGTDLSDANLSLVDLKGVTDLTQAQLDAACGSSSPFDIPNGLTWRSGPCVRDSLPD